MRGAYVAFLHAYWEDFAFLLLPASMLQLGLLVAACFHVVLVKKVPVKKYIIPIMGLPPFGGRMWPADLLHRALMTVRP